MSRLADTDFVKELKSLGIELKDGFVIVGTKHGGVDVYAPGVRLTRGLEKISVAKSAKRFEDSHLFIDGELRFRDGKPKFEDDEAEERLLSALSWFLGYELLKGDSLVQENEFGVIARGCQAAE